MSGLTKSMDLRSIKTSNDVLANKGLIICPYKAAEASQLPFRGDPWWGSSPCDLGGLTSLESDLGVL